MGSSEEISKAEEEKSEVKDPGINLDSAILNGGLDGLYLEMLAYGVEGLQVGKFLTLSPEGYTKLRLIMTVQYSLQNLIWTMKDGQISLVRKPKQ